MSIAFAILGLLTAGPRSGYDLKKLFVESESLHWSGNNNQIYKALVELHRDGLATREIEQPDEGPSRKLYSITETGRDALRKWLESEPELPDIRLPILSMLISADLLSADELDRLLGRYAEALRLRILGMEELERRGKVPSFGSERQRAIWHAINQRALDVHRAEEEWVRNLRWNVAKLPSTELP